MPNVDLTKNNTCPLYSEWKDAKGDIVIVIGFCKIPELKSEAIIIYSREKKKTFAFTPERFVKIFISRRL